MEIPIASVRLRFLDGVIKKPKNGGLVESSNISGIVGGAGQSSPKPCLTFLSRTSRFCWSAICFWHLRKATRLN